MHALQPLDSPDDDQLACGGVQLDRLIERQEQLGRIEQAVEHRFGILAAQSGMVETAPDQSAADLYSELDEALQV